MLAVALDSAGVLDVVLDALLDDLLGDVLDDALDVLIGFWEASVCFDVMLAGYGDA